MIHSDRLVAVAIGTTFLMAGGFPLRSAGSYVVAGIVVDSRSKDPISNVHVSIAPTTQRGQRLDQFTKKDGRFVFSVGAPGKYELQVTKPGYPRQSYRQATLSGLSSAIVVAEEQDTSHIVFEAFHGGAISGQIKDENAEPVGNALVSILQTGVVGGERKIVMLAQVRADANGVFRVANLHRGDYYVCAMGRPWFADSLLGFQRMAELEKNLPARDTALNSRPATPANNDSDADPQQKPIPYSIDPSFRGTAFQTTCFPSSQTIEDASTVHLETAAEAQASLTLPLARAVTLNGSIAATTEAVAGTANLLRRFNDNYLLFLQTAVSKEGKFQFKNVPPGIYTIAAASSSSSGTSSWHVMQEVAVNSSDTEITLHPDALGGVSGHVSFEGEPPSSNANMVVSLRNEQGIMIPIQVDQSGNFTRSRLPAGKYEILAGSREYVAAYSSSVDARKLPLTLEISPGEIVRRDVSFTRAISVIDGRAQKNGVPQVGALVLLMPTDSSRRWAYRADQSDSDGSFQLSTIPAGDYYFVILSDGADILYREPPIAAALAKVAKLVHIAPGDHQMIEAESIETQALKLPGF
jgi:hypothetical protein